jgi:hypothetical protein
MERAIIDMRLHVSAHTTEHLWQLVNDFLEHAKATAPPEINVRYTQLRPGKRSRSFEPTIEPAKR